MERFEKNRRIERDFVRTNSDVIKEKGSETAKTWTKQKEVCQRESGGTEGKKATKGGKRGVRFVFRFGRTFCRTRA